MSRFLYGRLTNTFDFESPSAHRSMMIDRPRPLGTGDFRYKAAGLQDCHTVCLAEIRLLALLLRIRRSDYFSLKNINCHFQHDPSPSICCPLLTNGAWNFRMEPTELLNEPKERKALRGLGTPRDVPIQRQLLFGHGDPSWI
jgi:hypothetical protein